MSSRLIDLLADAAADSSPEAHVEILETHLSWVLLAGEFAYKIKKPVVLPFADFGTLAARQRYCREELRLNRRLAPQIYLDVVPITGSAEAPKLEGDGTPLEYAVKMRRFEQDALFNRLLARDELRPEILDELAKRIASFHDRIPAATDTAFGTPANVLQPALDNFSELTAHAGRERLDKLEELADWTRHTGKQLESVFAARRHHGRVRECHGDLHLRNIALIDGQPVAFDCIEFNAGLRWIDVINEAAFLVMDLLDRGRPDLGYRFLNGYLAETGDYSGVTVLRFYLVYRALVRAKVHDLRGRQADADPAEAERLQATADHYVALAGDIAHGARPALILMHGFSGSGKTGMAAALSEALGAIHLRSDVERKRMFGLDATAQGHAAVNAGIYDRGGSARTYAHLAELAETILQAGYPTILDATFLMRGQRQPMLVLAERLGAPFKIVDCTAQTDTLRERVIVRATRLTDASEATVEVLDHQLACHEPLTAAEQSHLVRCNTEGPEAGAAAACVAEVLQRLDLGQPAISTSR